MTETKLTNKDFAETNKLFRDCCAKADIDPTTRQASKWRNRKGLAFSMKFI
jgi:hypothetical protein